MKNTTLFLAYIMTVISCGTPAENEPINVFKQNHVKELRTYSFEYKFGSIDSSTKSLSKFQIFNSEGQSIVEEHYSKKINFDYAVYPAKLEFISDTLFINRKYQAKEDDEIVETIARNSGKEFTLSNKGVYDKTGRLTELVVYDDEGDMEEKTIIKYDRDQSVEIIYDQYGKIKSKTVKDKKSEIEFDAEGKILIELILIKESKGYLEYSKSDSTSGKKITKIDSDSASVYTEFDSNANEVYKIKTDLKNGLIIKQIIYSNGEPKNLYVHEYKFYNK